MKASISILIIALLTTGCLGGGSDGVSPIVIPIVSFECSGVNPDCAAGTGRTVYLGLLSDTNIECSDYLDGQITGQFHYGFEASGSAVGNFSGGFLVGDVSNWINGLGVPIGSLPDTNYKVCAYLDSNSDQTVGVNEMIADEVISLSDIATNLTIYNWEPNQ